MRQKIALAAASVAATATLTIALAAAGFGPAAPVTAAADPTATPTPIVQVDNVYLAPKPTQQTITIQQSAAGGETEGAGDD